MNIFSASQLSIDDQSFLQNQWSTMKFWPIPNTSDKYSFLVCSFFGDVQSFIPFKFPTFLSRTYCKIYSLRKHAYSNISPPKTENFRIKTVIFFHISAQNIDCGYSLEMPWWGISNKYPQSMFLSRNKKNNVDPCKPQFYYIKVGFKGVI